MEIRLTNLKILNFMGCKELDIDMSGQNMKVYGDNASGKTTLMHAFNWLLFDKNAYGKTDFGIKPYDAAGEVIHRLETSVEALFDIDGQPKSFRKVLTEKWTRKRGTSEEAYTGNEIAYYVNTVPKKKKEYTEEIARLIDENVFRMITNPLYFNEHIDWKDRRKMLLEICGNISDEMVIASDRELAPLLDLLKGRTVEELKSIISSEMKNANKELGMIPARIAEAELAKPKPRADVDVSALEELERKHREKVAEMSSDFNETECLRIESELKEAERELRRAKAEGWNKYVLEEFREFCEADSKMREFNSALHLLEKTIIPQLEMQIKSNQSRKEQLSKEWDDVFNQAFTGSICPTCGQELPPDEVATKKREFNAKKSMSLDRIEDELELIKKRDVDLNQQKAEAEKQVEYNRAELEKMNPRLDELDKILVAKEAEFEEGKKERVAALEKKIEAYNNDLLKVGDKAKERVAGIVEEIAALEAQIKPIKDYLAEVSMIERQTARIEELKESQERLSFRYTELENQLFLTEQFIRRKVSMINEMVNSRFKLARFKLFDVQVNGGIAETCEATYLGIPYRDLNTAGKINTGLDIINTLSTVYGITAPIFVDNMESVTRPIDTLAQRIELIVSEKDKTLRFEKVE